MVCLVLGTSFCIELNITQDSNSAKCNSLQRSKSNVLNFNNIVYIADAEVMGKHDVNYVVPIQRLGELAI